MPGTPFLIAVSITVEPFSPSTVRGVPSKSMKVILVMENNRMLMAPARICRSSCPYLLASAGQR
jgi:hypothetical protein